jgi:cell division GTPase FtsZ
LEEKIKELEKKVLELYSIVKTLDEYVKSQTEVNTEISNLLKPTIIKLSSLDQEVGFLNDNLISTIKNNNTMHDALNKSIESIMRMVKNITS